MWFAVVVIVLLVAVVALLLLVGNVLYGIYEELQDQTAQQAAARSVPAPVAPPRPPVRAGRTVPPKG